MTKTLALKGMYGLVGVGATVGSVFYLRSQLSYSDTDHEVEKLSVVELLGKVGLECGLNENEELTDSKECSVKTEGSINVKVGEKSEEGVSFSSSGTSKLKVSKGVGYPKNLKFVVDSGDLQLTKTGGTSSIPKLEQFETYEIKREGGKFYLSRKLEAKEGKKDALGLPSSCTLPGAGNSDCTLDKEEIKGVKFDNHSGGVTVSNGDVKLKISGVEDTASFPEKYKFTFTFPQEVTINSKKIKGNIPTDFKIKKEENSNTLTLERAWTPSSLGAKVGLTCSNDTECTIQDSGGLKVKQISEDGYSEIKQTSLTKKSGGTNNNGKIKVTKDVEGYNQGFKFEISEGFIELEGSTGTSENEKITRLGEYETYEIKEEGTEWYLAIKDKADVFVLEQLGLTNISGCSSLKLPRSTTGMSDCRIKDINVLKKIKFGNADGHSWTGELSENKTIQLLIGQESSFPVGFKFTFTDSDTDVCLPDGKGGSVDLKTSSGDVDYKIKKTGTGENISLTLEKK